MWGGRGYPPYLSNYLGSAWKMYNGGCAGDRTGEIMFRQGSVRLKFSSDYTFTYPYTTELESSVVLEETQATSGVTYSYRPARLSYVSSTLLNPCTINGIQCKVTETGVTPLEECADVPGDWISSYGSTISPNVDVNVYYIGRNGGFNSVDQLVLQNKAMVEYGSEKYIVLGFHEVLRKIASVKNSDYVAKMEKAFGDHFLNLNKEIRLRAAELTYLTGVYDVRWGFYLNDEDYDYVASGDIPKSFYYQDLMHESNAGLDAIAILVHDKMVKLGYLNDNYILSNGGDL